MKNVLKKSFLVASIAILSSNLYAEPLAVTASVVNACTFSSSPTLAFGVYSPASASTVQNSTVAVTCTNTSGYSIASDIGTGSGASYTNRKLTAAGSTLNYNLYLGTNQTQVWGDGTSSTQPLTGTGNGLSQVIEFNGQIPSGQTSVMAGSFTDTVTMTVTFS